jgi:effector-binding domain-containing protein
VIKKLEPQKVASLRETIPAYDAQGPLWEELVGFLKQHGAKFVGPCLTVYHDTEFREQDVDVEVCEPIDASLPDHPRIKVRELPAIEMMASIIHSGSYDGFNETYTALMAWIEANGYRIVGPNREIYLKGPTDTEDPSAWVTEVQFPVVKA